MLARMWAVFLPLLALAVSGQEVVQPEIAVPGQWMTDTQEKFLFLPLTVPADLSLKRCKIFSNGDSILVVITETVEEEPESKAMTKYKLVVEAIKEEANGDEKLLKQKLSTWYDTEDDDEVKVQVKAALDSLVRVREMKKNDEPRTVTVPMGLLVKEAEENLKHGGLLPVSGQRSSFLQRHSFTGTPSVATEVGEAEHMLTSLHKATTQAKAGGEKSNLAVGIIKESFAVEIPYPVPTEEVFILQSKPDELMVSMPLRRNSLEAKGISTGGKPFNRAPIFSMDGKQIAGPTQNNGLAMSIATSVDKDHLDAAHGDLKPLQ